MQTMYGEDGHRKMSFSPFFFVQSIYWVATLISNESRLTQMDEKGHV